MSTFVWLDYSERERRKMLDLVDLFKEHDTRDELGIGSVRDAFSDMLFPGTSTIMTRARYFLLVPWTYQRLERQRVPVLAPLDCGYQIDYFAIQIAPFCRVSATGEDFV